MMKAIVLNNENIIWAKKAIGVATTLNRGSSKWGKMVHDRCYQTYGTSLKFLGYCETRWNSLQMLMASLLRIRTSVRIFTSENMFDADLKDCNTIEFWNNLVRMEKLVRPLATASFVMERNSCTLADCTHIHLILFENENAAQKEIETSWNNLEQSIFY